MACWFPSWPHHSPDGHLTHTRPWPCGQCSGCRLERSRHWATRCMNEAQLHKRNCYITLTYNDANLPAEGLRYRDWQLFLKRLRKSASREKKPPVRFYMSGEYGEATKRPHFHAALFGYDFDDKVFHKQNHRGDRLYTSSTLDRLWNKGFASVGTLTFESAAYIARYIMKKQTGDPAHVEAHYRQIDEHGEITYRTPEMNQMSRRPGIGHRWINTYTSDVYPTGEMIINGHRAPPPRYYDNIYKKQNEKLYKEMKLARRKKGDLHSKHKTPQRLKVQQQVHEAKIQKLKRKL